MNIDDTAAIKALDSSDVLDSVVLLPVQFEAAWTAVKSLAIPQEYTGATNIVVSGMGGSALGGRVIHALYGRELRAPIEVSTGYHVPGYVGKNTLLIASSYSGNTEETLQSFHEARERGAMIFGIADAGKLMELCHEAGVPFYNIDPTANPSGQPRLAVGYSIGSILSLLAKLHFITLSDEDFTRALKDVASIINGFGPDTPLMKNPAKKLATTLVNKIPILVASEHLVGAAHTTKNQLNESAKSFSALFDLPEMDHHLMEGLKNPEAAKKDLHFLMFASKLYSERVQKRYPITADVIEQNHVDVTTYELFSPTKLSQVIELLSLGSYIQMYLAALYGIDPAPIPWVNYFKEQMAK